MQFFVSLAVCVRADEANNCCLNSLHSPNDDLVPSKVKFSCSKHIARMYGGPVCGRTCRQQHKPLSSGLLGLKHTPQTNIWGKKDQQVAKDVSTESHLVHRPILQNRIKLYQVVWSRHDYELRSMSSPITESNTKFPKYTTNMHVTYKGLLVPNK